MLETPDIVSEKLPYLRTEYSRASLSKTEVDADPLRQFKRWFAQAFEAGIAEPNVMTLATVGENGRPSARIVLVKEIDARSLIFFTHYESRKGRELAHTPYASLLFHWMKLERQVRIEGAVEKMEAAYNDTYFESRPLTSRISAWASQQSAVIQSRAELEARFTHFAKRFGEHPPRPPNWGGYRLIPDVVEFWQGRPSRLHDRIQYTRTTGADWKIVRLSP
ncbi:pyridoxamine 5'-phosphate oxidase [Candidatus Glomeribacter gigasporarum]|uniref:pyridoxamine 5'-phosphate oxidase n=1 Tax=Candidatus Glomeribacter gigasporarum TaxID=132144 RepID=UPI0002DEF821|nr:pyridoxamine 5'-phosphate oxidase [Candidatus Glomeribacter gigasporarum]